MGMQGYYDVFPDKWRSEIRTAVIEFDETHRPVDPRSLPDGTYLFTEYYCTDLDCHCERVLVKVLLAESEGARLEEVATIGYSWNPNRDAAWAEVNFGIPNPFLDPLNRQADYAPELLEFWTSMIERDKAYVARLRRHYAEIRAEVGQPTDRPGQRNTSNKEARWSISRPLTKRDRKARRRMLARARKQK
jgi:hypothetical protein